MVNVVNIIVPIIVGVLILAVSLYLFTVYCHPEEKGFGNEVFPKILVILSQTLAWGQILILPLDLGVGGAMEGSSFYLVYDIIYAIIFVLIAFVNPFAMFFYESDQSETLGHRIGWSCLFAGIVGAIWVAYVFISYVWLGVVSSDQRIDVMMYILLALSLVGWVLLAFNGAVGLVFLPMDLIGYFMNKPTPLSTQQALEKKSELERLSGELITEGEGLKQKEEEMRQFDGGWFGRKRMESQFNGLFDKFKSKVNKMEEEYQLFSTDVKRVETHPVVHFVALLFGIISVILSCFWWFQMLGQVIMTNGVPLYSFMDSWLSGMAEGSASFVSTLIYGLLVIYMQICLMKGNIVFGIRIPYLVKVHPMLVNKTYMNSLLFNCNLMLLASCAISFQGLWSFPVYFTPSSCYFALIFNTEIINLPLFGSLYGHKVPMIILMLLTLVVLVFVVVRAVWRYCTRKDKKEKEEKKEKKEKDVKT